MIYYLKNRRKLKNIDIKRVKITVSAPVENINNIRDSVCKAGAGIIGNYIWCSLSTKCVGTFKPISKSNPYIGKKDTLEFIDEEKLEVVCDIDNVKKVITELRKVHPYEEPAINIIPLLDENSFDM